MESDQKHHSEDVIGTLVGDFIFPLENQRPSVPSSSTNATKLFRSRSRLSKEMPTREKRVDVSTHGNSLDLGYCRALEWAQNPT
jgi:hypothetical protein